MKIPTCISIPVEIEEIKDETRAYPIKDASGNPTDRKQDHRIVTASGYAKSLDGKRERDFVIKWFDPPVGTDLPVVGKPYVVEHFRSIIEDGNHSYTINM